MRNLKIAKVYWRDATHYRNESDIDWCKKEACTTDFVTVGHIIRVGRREVIIAHEITDEDRARDTSVIPRELISKIQYLKDE